MTGEEESGGKDGCRIQRDSCKSNYEPTFFCFAFISLTAKRKKQIWRIETVVFGVPFDGAFVDGVVDGIDVCVGGCGGGGCGDGGNSNIVVFAFVTLRHLEKRVKEEAGEREEYDRGKSEKEVRCGVVY
ncbi:unnamed protein product [Enterobius vermicularis]|uniref:Uncharacterized protein n=1 Tax=Enterobius vermicularis TaxID=51028 RepID=A0A0N4VN56_ENTVE|nr:unnamed protein product [Enterobius vermicularis]